MEVCFMAHASISVIGSLSSAAAHASSFINLPLKSRHHPLAELPHPETGQGRDHEIGALPVEPAEDILAYRRAHFLRHQINLVQNQPAFPRFEFGAELAEFPLNAAHCAHRFVGGIERVDIEHMQQQACTREVFEETHPQPGAA